MIVVRPLRRPAIAALVAVGLVPLAAIAPGAAQTADVMLPVPTTTLYPGDAIEPNHIIERRFRLGARNPLIAIENRSQVVGKVARRTLLPGQPIPLNAVDNPQLVRRGVPAQVVFSENGLVITGVVEPLQSGTVNEMVRAKNPDSGLTITGIVQPDGSIRVGGE